MILGPLCHKLRTTQATSVGDLPPSSTPDKLSVHKVNTYGQLGGRQTVRGGEKGGKGKKEKKEGKRGKKKEKRRKNREKIRKRRKRVQIYIAQLTTTPN